MKRKPHHFLIKWLTVFLLFSILLNVLTFRLLGQRSVSTPPSPSPTPRIESATLLQHIEGLGELVSTQYTYQSTAHFETTKTFYDQPIPFTSKYFTITYTGYVKAGIDLSKATLTLEEGGAILVLPPATIFEKVISEDTLRILDQSSNPIQPLQIQDFNTVLGSEKDKLVARALSEGILTEATTQCEKIIRQLLTFYGIDNVTIRYIPTS